MRIGLSPLLGMLLALVTSGAVPIHAQAAPAHFPLETEAALQMIVDKHLTANGAPGVDQVTRLTLSEAIDERIIAGLLFPERFQSLQVRP